METMHVYGYENHLFGIHTTPESTAESPSCHAVLMLTAGMLPSYGPMRLHTILANSLALHGVPSMRFDLSGIGESLAIGSQGTSLERASNEVRQTMDFLGAQYGYTRFSLFGLCSGADDGLAAAIDDERIVGAAFMDACGYRTVGYYPHMLWKKYGPKILSPRKWCDWLGTLTRGSSQPTNSMPMGSDIREFPDREPCQSQILKLIDRGVRLNFLYTSGVMDYFSYREQFFAMFPRLKNRTEISLSYHPEWDHVVMLEEDRLALVDELVAWFLEADFEFKATKHTLAMC